MKAKNLKKRDAVPYASGVTEFIGKNNGVADFVYGKDWIQNTNKVLAKYAGYTKNERETGIGFDSVLSAFTEAGVELEEEKLKRLLGIG